VPVARFRRADPAGAEREWEEILRRLEDAGISVAPVDPGCAFFETHGVERLYAASRRC